MYIGHPSPPYGALQQGKELVEKEKAKKEAKMALHALHPRKISARYGQDIGSYHDFSKRKKPKEGALFRNHSPDLTMTSARFAPSMSSFLSNIASLVCSQFSTLVALRLNLPAKCSKRWSLCTIEVMQASWHAYEVSTSCKCKAGSN